MNHTRVTGALAAVVLLSACQNASRTPQLEPTATLPPQARATSVVVAEPTPIPTARPTVRPAVAETAFDRCDTVDLALTDPEAVSASDGRVVYQNEIGNLSVVSHDGSGRIDVTTDAVLDRERRVARQYQFPVFSPDAQSLAFVRLDFDNGITTQSVQVAEVVSDATALNLFGTNDFNIPYLDWSPDSQNVAFLTIRPGAGGIRVVSRDAAAFGTFALGAPTYWHWRTTPDGGTGMVTHLGGRADSAASAAFIGLTSMVSVTLTNTQKLDALPGAFQSPHASPDGRYVLYVLNTEADQDELLIGRDDGTPVCTLASVLDGAFFAWSPDGRKVALLDSADPLRQPAPIRVFDLEERTERTVKQQGMAFFWSPDSQRLAVLSAVRASEGTKLAAPARQNERGFLRFEAVTVADGSAIKVADTLITGEFGQYLPFFDQYSRSLSPWSPNGRHLVFAGAADDTDVTQVVVASFDFGTSSVRLKSVGAGAVAFFSPR
jgi:hypothetical protein